MIHELRDDEEDGRFARNAFTAAVADTTPRLGFGVEDLVHGGRARVRRRRWSAAAGGVAVAAAVSVGLATGAAGFGASAVTAGDASGTPAQQAAADSKLGYQAMEKLLKDLGQGPHITLDEPLTPESFLRPSMCNGQNGAFGYIITGSWTADGKVPGATDPHVTVMISFGNAKYSQSAPGSGGNGWGPATTVTLPDHSVLTSVANHSSDGQSATAVRTLSDGRSLLVFVLDEANPAVHEPRPAQQVVPFPFTGQQLAQAAGDMSLTFPFAHGYEPTEACPGPAAR
jgi:hypothetical protein